MLTVLTFLRALSSAQSAFDITLLIINIATFFYMRCYIQKRLEEINKNRDTKNDNFKKDFKANLEKKLENEVEKIHMKITFLDELIDIKLEQEKITRELKIDGLSNSFKKHM